MANLNHVALLVNNIESFIQKNSQLGRLLLMQVIGDGPYKNALEKRGVGLHHIAIDVPKVDDFAGELAGSGWLLHPKSLWFYDDNKQIFLARPEAPTLIEVQERTKPATEEYLIDSIELPLPTPRLAESLCCPQIKLGTEFKVFLNGKPMSPVFD